MNNIVRIGQFDLAMVKQNIHRESWTAIIPAAGIGSRLDFEHPKILFPVGGKTILEHLLDILSSVCSKIVLVLSPAGAPIVRKKLDQLGVHNVVIVLQEKPTGMADAILKAEVKVKTKNILVVWGDQVTLNIDTIQVCAYCHESRSNAKLTLPTIHLRNPYIHFERNEDQKITNVLQAREREVSVEIGENDCGLFLFESKALFSKLKDAREKISYGGVTGEYNLLPLLPDFDQLPGDVVTVRIEDESEALGINSREDVMKVEQALAHRKKNHD